MLSIDPDLLKSLAHPCIGGCIGYLTSAFALRMLFRPLRPRYLFGLRVPMTPGVVPSRRHDLARNIGEMVGDHLLTGKEICRAILDQPFQAHLALLVDRKVDEVFKREFGPLPEIIPERFKAYFQIGVKTLKYQVGEGVNSYLASTGFEEKVTGSILSRLDDLADQELNRLLSPENRQSLYCLLHAVIADVLRSNHTAEWLAGYLAASLHRSAAQGCALADLLPQPLAALLPDILRTQLSAMIMELGCRGPDPMGHPELQTGLAMVLAEKVDSLLHQDLSSLLEQVDQDLLGSIGQAWACQLLALFRTDEAMTGVSALTHVGMEELLDHGQQPLSGLAEKVFPGEKGAEIRDAVVRECLALFRSSRTERLVSSMVNSMVDALLSRPVGRLSDIVPHGLLQGGKEYLILTANRMLLQGVPGVVESLNIQRMVTGKIKALKPLQLERLLRSIMQDRFKYIQLCGALLGFLLGLINLALVKLG